MELEDKSSLLQRELQTQRLDAVYGGLWLDATELSVVVALTDVNQHSEDVYSAATAVGINRENIEVTQVEHSLSTLEQIQDQMISDRTAIQEGRAARNAPSELQSINGRYDLDVDVIENRLVIYTQEAEPAIAQAVAETYGVEFEHRTGLAEPACNRIDCRFDMMAGLRLRANTSNDNGRCSSAFGVAAVVTDRRFVLTAGHCSLPNRYNGGSLYGNNDRTVVRDQMDAQRVVRTNSSWGESGQMWIQSNDIRSVRSVVSHAAITINSRTYGKTGSVTGTTRGTVSSKSYSPSYVTNGRQFVVIEDSCALPGDSGGGVFRNNGAVGIVAATRDADTLCPDRDPDDVVTIFGAVSFAIDELNVQIILGP